MINQTWKTRAQSINVSRKQEHDKLIAKLSPSQIKEENSKRRLLAKRFKASKANTRLIKDPNAPKKPLTAFLRFFMEHYTPGTAIPESSKEASRLWKSMSEAEKRVHSPILALLTDISHINKRMILIKNAILVKKLRITRVDLEDLREIQGWVDN